MSLKRIELFKIFKWFLIVTNIILTIVALIGIYLHFNYLSNHENFKLNTVEEGTFSNNLKFLGTGKGVIPYPETAREITTYTFVLLLAIPCVGLIGAIIENTFLSILYAVVMFLYAFVLIIFKSPFFILPAVIASAAFGLVFLIGNIDETDDSTDEIDTKDGLKYRMIDSSESV